MDLLELFEGIIWDLSQHILRLIRIPLDIFWGSPGTPLEIFLRLFRISFLGGSLLGELPRHFGAFLGGYSKTFLRTSVVSSEAFY